MTKDHVRAVLERVPTWLEDRQQELVEVALEIEAALSGAEYEATPDELAAIDEGLAEKAASKTMRLPDSATFAKEVQYAVKSGVVLGTRRYILNKHAPDQQKINYYRAHPHKWFLIYELYDMLKRLWNFEQVTSSLLRPLWNEETSAQRQNKLRDTCQFSAMGNLLVHLGYAAHDKLGAANVYRREASRKRHADEAVDIQPATGSPSKS